jgi:hypothetical protein
VKLFGIWPLAGKKESALHEQDAIRRKRMESQLLERIYSGPRRTSTQRPLRPIETTPLGYEQAFGAYARLTCNILTPDDFARGMIHHHGMDFDAFVSANHIELIDDDQEAT